MAAVERILLQAVEHFVAGRPEQADALCGEVLKAHPDHVPALHLSAVVAFVTERASDGAVLLNRVFSLDPEHAPTLDDFADTATSVAALDLVVVVDTRVAHLPGALGRPVWMLLP